MPLDAARDGLIAAQGQLIAGLAAQSAALAERVAQLEAVNAEGAGQAGTGGLAEFRELVHASLG
jgi:hypothetical protein